MRRRTLLLAGGTAATTAMSGCLGSIAGAGGDDNSGSNPTRTITVSGDGAVTTAPDEAQFNVAVEATGDDIEAVRDELSERIEVVRGALLDAGLEESAVTTGRFRISQVAVERREEREVREDQVEEEGASDPVPPEESDDTTESDRYYEGSHGLDVTVAEVEAVGTYIDVAVDAGADDIGRVTFGLSEETRESYRDSALSKAIEDATGEADHIAAEVGAEVVDVKHVDSTGSSISPYRMDVMEDVDDSAPSTEIHPDDVSVHASVEVVVLIE